ncbi:hypothetical protein BW13_04775 [Bifidobacterium sp. UTCIF-37]|uniref:hypothetical protein n=1 Tax=unclassified Bifidobacterium TaxID=2608897 RepID=UPI00112EA04C|nr:MULTISPECIES: hypothetical protein [unclassified Bifidobacterium]TPF86576.1 hypothetical protein BW13_04775 [Bifidobacterium sp. UTCIF-37]TPF89681.1 hypothetical protein BW11_04780 [Bifidobacterium sp. UTCIF-38]
MADDFDDDKDRSGRDSDPGDSHLTDEDIAKALEGFEKEFADEETSDMSDVDDLDPHPDSGVDDLSDDLDIDIPDDASSIDPSFGFEDALDGLLGNKAKMAALVTRIASAPLLAAFCQLSDISADCVGSNQGAIAVLRNLDGDGPEAAARDITTVVGGMSVVLGVNRADKLEVSIYAGGKAGETLAPPILFNSTPRFVEDLMLGITTVAQLKTQGFEVVDSGSLDHESAMKVIAEHTRFGRGGATRGSSID